MGIVSLLQLIVERQLFITKHGEAIVGPNEHADIQLGVETSAKLLGLTTVDCDCCSAFQNRCNGAFDSMLWTRWKL